MKGCNLFIFLGRGCQIFFYFSIKAQLLLKRITIIYRIIKIYEIVDYCVNIVLIQALDRSSKIH